MGSAAPSKIPQKVDDSTLPSIKDISNESIKKEENSNININSNPNANVNINISEKSEWIDQKREYNDIKKTKSSTKEWNDSLNIINESIDQKNITPIKPKYDTNFTTPPIKQKPTPLSKPRPPPNRPQSITAAQSKSKTPSRTDLESKITKDNNSNNIQIKVDPISTQMSLEIKQENYENSTINSRIYTPDKKDKSQTSQFGVKIISKVKQCVDGNVDDSDSDDNDENNIDDSTTVYDWTLSQTQGPSTHPDVKIPSTPLKSDHNNDYTKDYSIIESKQFLRSTSEKDDEFIGDFRNYDINSHDDYIKPDIVPMLNLSVDTPNHSQHHAHTLKFSSAPMTGAGSSITSIGNNNNNNNNNNHNSHNNNNNINTNTNHNNIYNTRNTTTNIPHRMIMQKPGFGPTGRGPGPARGPPTIRPTIVTTSSNRTTISPSPNHIIPQQQQNQQQQQQQQQQQLHHHHLQQPHTPQHLIQTHIPQHHVKETKDVKRNRAQLPSTLTHAQPTTGDWLKKRYIVNNYILLDLLGTGSYGEVKLCKDRTTDKLYAMKIFSKEMLKKRKGGNTSETYFEDIKREIAIMKKLSHPNVLKLFEVLDDPKVNKMYLVLEYMKRGDLIKFLKNRDNGDEKDFKDIPKRRNSEKLVTLSDAELKVIFTQVVAGVKYLHFQNIIHGDIKPQNILVGDDNIVKIADFGISKMLENGSAQKLVDAGGTPAFMAPELCSATAEAFSGQLADIWAIGATMYMLRFGQPPFVASNVLALYNKIINDPLEFPQVPIDPGLRNLLVNMLEKDPKLRYNMDQITSHPWLRFAPRPVTTLSILNQQSDLNTSIKSEKQVLQLTDQYFNDEAEAMKGPKKTVDKEDIYRSIGYGIETKHRGDSVDSQESNELNSSNSSSSDDRDDRKGKVLSNIETKEEKNKQNEEEYEDIMATNWAADVFEQVDDADIDSNDDDDDDDDDEIDGSNYDDSDSNEGNNKGSYKQHNNKILNKIETKNDKKYGNYSDDDDNNDNDNDVDEDKIKTPVLKPTQSKLNMDEKEQDRRSKDFKSKLLAKTSHYQMPKLSSKDSVDIDDDDSNSVSTDNNYNTTGSGGGNGSIKYKSPSKNKNRKKSVDIGTDPVEELSMDDFEEMMDTLAMRPVNNSMKGKSEPINVPFLISNILLHSNAMNLHNGIGGVSYSDQGCRRTQEDSIVLMLNFDVNNPNFNFLKNNENLQYLSVAAIFDGHNGDYCSKYLSKTFVTTLLENQNIFSYKTLKQAMIETCQQVDLEVCKELKRLNDSSGSTGVIVLYEGRSRRFTVANVGDSKCILCRGGYAVQIHRTHRVGDHEDEVIRIQNAGGSVVNRRVNGVLAISRAFGDTSFKDENNLESSLVVANPDVYSEIITPMTEFCVIASDGLWDVMDSQTVVNYIRERINDKNDVEDIVQELVNDSIEKGSIDNVSVIILIFHLDKVSPIRCDLPTIDSLSKIHN